MHNMTIMSAVCVCMVVQGCASRQAVIEPPGIVERTPITPSNRFNMTQNGRQMSADDFDAWMKARGIRIAKGSSPVKKNSRRR